MASTNLAKLIQQFSVRYRALLLTKIGILAALSAGIVGVLVWRLHARDAGPMWGIGLPVILGCAAAGGLGWWLRHHWLSSHGGAAFLDRTLGLQERLVTAEEFSHATQAPTRQRAQEVAPKSLRLALWRARGPLYALLN